MGTKAYTGTARQSDIQSAKASNPAYYGDEWDAIGPIQFWYWEALLNSGWNCYEFYESCEEMFLNACCAYYILLFNFQRAQERHPDDWETHFFPRVTLQNTVASVLHLFSRCCYWPKDIPFAPSKTREIIIEGHFGVVKAPFRGTPKLRDMIHGTVA